MLYVESVFYHIIENGEIRKIRFEDAQGSVISNGRPINIVSAELCCRCISLMANRRLAVQSRER